MLVVGLLFSQPSAFAAEADPLPPPGKAVDAPPREPVQNREQPQAPRGQAALTVGVPFLLDKVVIGELTVDFRYGYKFWWLVPYVSGGFRQARLRR